MSADEPPAARGGRPTPATGSTPRETSVGLTSLAAGTVVERLCLLVISDHLVATYPLPETGEVIIGRSPKCDVMIDDPSISRSHAALLVGSPLVIRDLGSANGTRVREQLLPKNVPFDVEPGDVMQVGSATIIAQRRSLPIRARRLWAHDYFEVRLDEECERAARSGGAFALVRLRCVPVVPSTVMQDALAALVRGADVVGEYGPSEYEVLLIDTPAEEATVAANRLVSELAHRDIAVRFGVACYPRDGRNSDELVAGASPEPRLREAAAEAAVGAVVVADRRMRDLYKLAERVAAGTISVLILGETGVGKEVLAERVHTMSPRAGKPYLRLNCAALSETLLESELFGHERGAFTGAVAAKQGLLETAHGGTVFLDEMGELSMTLQVKLLRVIEDHMVLRVGGLKARSIDVRFIAATNRDLEAEVARGAFRQDLFFRLNGATLVIPPLRERTSEIPDLARVFLAHAAKAAGLPAVPVLSSDALEALVAYPWPGNIRELRNMIERAVLLCGDGPLLPAHLPQEKMRTTFGMRPTPSARPPDPVHAAAMAQKADRGAVVAVPSAAGLARRAAPVPTLPPGGPPPAAPEMSAGAPHLPRRGYVSEDEERRLVEEAMQACAGNQTAAAERLGISRRTLINRLEEFGMARPRKR